MSDPLGDKQWDSVQFVADPVSEYHTGWELQWTGDGSLDPYPSPSEYDVVGWLVQEGTAFGEGMTTWTVHRVILGVLDPSDGIVRPVDEYLRDGKWRLRWR